MTLLDRYTKPTPTFFRKLRNIGIAMAASAGAILTAPISFSALVITIASYIAVVGTVITSVSQAVVSDSENESESNGQ